MSRVCTERTQEDWDRGSKDADERNITLKKKITEQDHQYVLLTTGEKFIQCVPVLMLCINIQLSMDWMQFLFAWYFFFQTELSLSCTYTHTSLKCIFIPFKMEQVRRKEKLLIRIKNSRAKQNTTASPHTLSISMVNIKKEANISSIYVKFIVYRFLLIQITRAICTKRRYTSSASSNKNTNVQFFNRNSLLLSVFMLVSRTNTLQTSYHPTRSVEELFGFVRLL